MHFWDNREELPTVNDQELERAAKRAQEVMTKAIVSISLANINLRQTLTASLLTRSSRLVPKKSRLQSILRLWKRSSLLRLVMKSKKKTASLDQTST